MGGACSTYGRGGGAYKAMAMVMAMRDRIHLEVPDIDRRIILKWVFSK
jgi:hypothetical protein